MSETATIEATIAGDWRIVAGVLSADMYRTGWKPRSFGVRDGVNMTIYDEGMTKRLADVALRIGDGVVYVQVKTNVAAAEAWQKELRYLAAVVDSIVTFNDMARPTAGDAIETYYRRRAAGGKVTLKMLAEETGYSLAYLKTAKRRYDAAGVRYGSKKKS